MKITTMLFQLKEHPPGEVLHLWMTPAFIKNSPPKFTDLKDKDSYSDRSVIFSSSSSAVSESGRLFTAKSVEVLRILHPT